MNVIDLDLYNPEPFAFKAGGKQFDVNFVSAVAELLVLQEQDNITGKAKKFSLINEKDTGIWRQILKKILSENKVSDYDKEVDELGPLQLLTVMMAFVNFLNKRSNIIYQIFDDKDRKMIEKAQDDLKKKAIQQASQESEL